MTTKKMKPLMVKLGSKAEERAVLVMEEVDEAGLMCGTVSQIVSFLVNLAWDTANESPTTEPAALLAKQFIEHRADKAQRVCTLTAELDRLKAELDGEE